MTHHGAVSRSARVWLACLLAALLLAPLSARLQAQDQGFTQAELDQMLAPIALFPDALLSQVLIAATYPLEVVDAARWSAANPNLSGGDAVRAVQRRDWDPAVKSLVAFPDLLARMDRDLDWTRRLGDAWLMQEEEVSDSIQALRRRADAAGHLRHDEHIRTRRERDVIIIEQARPEVVYVPYYRTTVVYGPWWHTAYPPVYWHPPVATGAVFYWGSGVRLYSNFFFTRFDWPRRHIVIINAHQPPQYHVHYHQGRPPRGGYTRWRHNPQHRRGVTYRSPALNRDFTRHAASVDANRRPVWQRDHDARRGHDANRRGRGGADTRSRDARPDSGRPEPGQWRGQRRQDDVQRQRGQRDAADTSRRMRPPATPEVDRRGARGTERERGRARDDAGRQRQNLTGQRQPTWQRGNEGADRSNHAAPPPRQERGATRGGHDRGQRAQRGGQREAGQRGAGQQRGDMRRGGGQRGEGQRGGGQRGGHGQR